MMFNNNLWEFLKEGFLNLIYPLSCENCSEEIRESKGFAICNNCMNQIKLIPPPFCYLCGKPLSSMVSFEEKAICADCHNKKNHYYFARSIAYYQGVMKKCIHLLKYKKQVKLVQPLGNLMVDYLRGNNSFNIHEIDLIVPVPLFKEDYLKRGFNQSGLLAKFIADYFAITFSEHLLIKNKSNVSQVGLSKIKRKNNVSHVYSISPSCEENFTSVLLVDDIFTTGATVEACCRELRKTGVKKLFVLTLARGI